jgi:hypothetical protein
MKNNNPDVRLLCALLPLAICLVVAWFPLCGCAHALRPYNQPTEVKLRVQSPNPQEYSVAVGDKAAVPILADGCITIHVPRLERGCAMYVLGIKVKDGSPYEVRAIQLNRGNRTVRKLSLNDVAKLPVDDKGYRVLKAE